MKWIGSAFVCMSMAFACGGGGSDGSGVDPTLELGELEPGEIDALCAYALDVTEPREVDCGDGVIVEYDADVEGCTDTLDAIDPACAATVLEMEICIEDLAALSDDEVCDETFFPDSCLDIFEDPDCGTL